MYLQRETENLVMWGSDSHESIEREREREERTNQLEQTLQPCIEGNLIRESEQTRRHKRRSLQRERENLVIWGQILTCTSTHTLPVYHLWIPAHFIMCFIVIKCDPVTLYTSETAAIFFKRSSCFDTIRYWWCMSLSWLSGIYIQYKYV